jgi:hypothetical protein
MYGVGVDEMVFDNNGNIITAGQFMGPVDFDPGPGIYNFSGSTCCDNIYVCKSDSDGNFLWVKKIGDNSFNRIGEIVCDNSGNIYVTGNFMNPSYNIFICKLNANGNILWTKRMDNSNSGFSQGLSIRFDSNGDILLAGYFSGTNDFDMGSGTYYLTSSGLGDIFIAKYDTSGQLLWAKSIGGTGHDYASSLSLDVNDNIYIQGMFRDTVDFDPGPGVFNLHSTPGSHYLFVSKLDFSGNFIWAKSIGAYDCDYSRAMVVDTLENIYLTGRFYNTVDFDPGIGVYNLTAINTNSPDIFVLRLDRNGDLIWVRQFGGPSDDRAQTIAIDNKLNVYTSGLFKDTVDFNPDAGVYNLVSNGYEDGYFSVLDAKGHFICAGQLGGTGSGSILTITPDNAGNIYGGGTFGGTVDFDPGSGTFNLTCSANCDGFTAKYGDCLLTTFQSEIKNHNLVIHLFPNPTTGLFTLHCPLSTINSQLNIYNSLGELVHQQIITSPNQQVDLNVKPGVYLVEAAGTRQKLVVY